MMVSVMTPTQFRHCLVSAISTGSLALGLVVYAANAQVPAPSLAAQATSSFGFETKDGQQIVTITNVTFQAIDPYIPGRKGNDRLVLRMTTQTKEAMDDIGVAGKVTVEAWPLGADLAQKARYSISLEGTGAEVMNQSVLVFDRGVEEVSWWSVYSLGKGQHLFDTYVPMIEFSISREFDTPRFVGFETRPDDTADKRLRDPHVVGVLSYASAERVIRETLLTCDDPKRADNFRSYADETREVALVEGPVPPAKGRETPEPTRTLKITFSQSYPASPNPVSALIPVAKDDLDLASAKLPPCLHAVAWKR